MDLEKPDIKSMRHDELTALMAKLGQPAYRAGQIFSWLHKEKASSFAQMTNLPLALRQQLEENCRISTVTPKQILRSQMDETVKFLFALADGACIEAVLMAYSYGDTLCISTQVGCNMGCVFCASTLCGKQRDLTAGEMLGQLDAAETATGRKISHVVLMGMGEPLDNFEQVTAFLDLVGDPHGRNLSARHITLSTCGLVPAIRQLAKQRRQITLTVSLHAADDVTRSSLMPVNRVYPMKELRKALVEYFDQTGRRISFEYTLIAGQNDTLAHAAALADYLGDFPCHVNLIPVNPVKERGLLPPGRAQVAAFAAYLEKRGYPATVRRTLGQDIAAACGQLRRASQAAQEAQEANAQQTM